MKYTKLGATGLDISRLCLGCMTFGDPEAGSHAWTVDENSARTLFRHAVEKGITFFDTANSYSAGTSELIVGKLLREFTRREEIVLATKVYHSPSMQETGNAPNAKGLSRKAIMTEIDASLRRLGTDYIDLYQIHRWDYNTPIEETMEALHDVVKSGKARYIGASSMYAWQFAKAQSVARTHGWTTFVSMQNHLNLLYREEEREMIPLCLDQNVGLMPYSPLARGRLARPKGEMTHRSELDFVADKFYKQQESADGLVIDAVEAVAQQKGLSMAQVAMAWILAKSGVSSPIIGASKISQIDDAVNALEVSLNSDEIAILEKNYIPHNIIGHN